MKVIRKTGNTKFGDLENGCVFTKQGYIYIKSEGEKEGSAVCLESGSLAYFEDYELVIHHPDAFLTLE